MGAISSATTYGGENNYPWAKPAVAVQPLNRLAGRKEHALSNAAPKATDSTGKRVPVRKANKERRKANP